MSVGGQNRARKSCLFWRVQYYLIWTASTKISEAALAIAEFYDL